MSLSERAGYILGYLLGVVTLIMSFLRQARMFHPRGLLYEAHVESVNFYPHALVRLSSAWWKKREWPDVLGIAIRFSPEAALGVIADPKDQDLLFASFSRWWLTPLGPFLTNYRDYFANHFYTVAPFRYKNQINTYRIKPKIKTLIQGKRSERVTQAVLSGEAVFILQEKNDPSTAWRDVAKIKLIRRLHFDQERLRFNPFQNGLGIRPSGFLQHLRIGAYRMGQVGRPNSAEHERFEV